MEGGSTRRPRAAVQRLRRCIDDDDGGNEDDDYDDDDDDDDAHTTAPRRFQVAKEPPDRGVNIIPGLRATWTPGVS